MNDKIIESHNLIDEIKYILKNYISLKYDCLEQRQNTETSKNNENSSKINKDDILNIKLKNSQLELLIEEKQTQIDIINTFLNEIG